MKVVWYSLARLGLFAAILFILWLVGWFDLIAVIASLVLAWLVGYLLLPGLRQAAVEQIGRGLESSKRGIKQLNAEEDAELESESPGDLEGDSQREQ